MTTDPATAAAPDVPWGHSIVAHRVLGWCFHCEGVAPVAEAFGWRHHAQGEPVPDIEYARRVSDGAR